MEMLIGELIEIWIGSSFEERFYWFFWIKVISKFPQYFEVTFYER